MGHKLNTGEFIKRAAVVHKGKYDYSLSQYNGYHSKIIIICPIHGEFSQIVASHLEGMGCKKCSRQKRIENNAVRKQSPYKGIYWSITEKKWLSTLLYKGKDIKLSGDDDHELYLKREMLKSELKPLSPIVNLKGEEWKDVNIDGGDYSISNKGRVKTYNYRNTGDTLILNQSINRAGYKYVSMKKRHLVHQLVAEYFLDGRNEVINHKDGDKSNNCADNLEWISSRSNRYHQLIVIEKRQYVGIKWSKLSLKWVSSISINGINIRLGVFSTQRDAHERFRRALLDYGLIDDYNYLVKIMDERGY